MSYQVLARKWRPKAFNELMGQEHVVSVLTNAISQQRLHHAYLFTGTRGVGKTTIARIFAKSLNCEQGVSTEPCEKCDVCLEIDHGRFVDLIEIDAASRTKVDDTREILDNVQYAPTRGRYKVYLIDEVHMLSRSSFNALLKTLEEPPEHVKFILATTDPQKLPITVLSRCLQFHLKALTVTQIEQQLEKILHAEQITYDAGSLTLLSRAARGSMRDSLSLTDQAIAQGQGNISIANLQQMLGGIDQHWPYKILMMLVKQDAEGVMALSKEIASYAPNYYRLFAELIQLLHHVALYQVVQQHFDLSSEHSRLIDLFSQAMSAQDIQLYYQLALNGRKDLPYAGDEQSAFEMTLLRLLAFKPMQSSQDALVEAPVLATNTSFDDIKLDDTNISVSQQSIKQPITALDSIENTLDQEIEAIEQAAQALTTKPQTQIVEPKLQSSRQLAPEENITQVESFIEEGEYSQLQQQNSGQTSDTVLATDNLKNTNISPSHHSNENPVATDSVLSASIESALATRNMLRSRKKKLENEPKKFDGATMRHQTVVQNKPKVNVPAIATLPEQGFEIDTVNPSLIKNASQVDKWANMIDAMSLNGRLRVLAQHAIISQLTSDKHLILELNQSAKHLKTDIAMEQLNEFVSEYLSQPIKVEVVIVEETIDDPLKIQRQINEKRYDYAKDLLSKDPIVIGLQQQFQAVINEQSIIAK